jgi:hypothetical protein
MKTKRTFLFARDHAVPPEPKPERIYQGRREMGNTIVTVNDADRPDGHSDTAGVVQRNLRWPFSPIIWTTIDRPWICIRSLNSR